MKNKWTYHQIILFTLSFIFFANQTFAQSPSKGQIKGQVMETQTNEPLSYASIRVFRSNDSTLVGGAISDEKGDFTVEVEYGQYYAILDFIGYKPFKTNSILLSKTQSIIDLGVVKLIAHNSTLEEVVVQAEKSSMELALDRKIFNVGLDLANAGGSATEILSNIPSVTVDAEGNVKLRGSDNVRILIDGKPSGLVSFKGGSGLQQLQASMVERVEIITNPSARYEAEGMSGIINIILKKDRQKGLNGSFDIITGEPTNYGVAANLNYRHKKINFFINYSLTYRIQPGRGTLYQEVYGIDTTFILKQNSQNRHQGFNNNIRGGLDFFFNEQNILTASYLFRSSAGKRLSDFKYQDFLFDLNTLNTYTTRRQDEKEIEPNSEYVVSYKKMFARKGQELITEVRFLDNWEKSDQIFTQYTYLPNGDLDQSKLQTSVNDESEKQLLFQVDYVHPFGKEGKLEAGARSSLRRMINDYIVEEQDENGDFFPLPGLDNNFVYDENISALYGIIGNKSKKISYQAGLRAEWTDVKTILRQTNEQNPRNYANLFPSVHFTYNLPKENALQISYSRRIRRPFYNDLTPFVTFSDNRNFFSGNPDLNPEFSHVFELGHLKHFEKASITSSIYYRYTNGKIVRIRRVNEQGFANTRPENLATENSYGAEFTGDYSPYKWWKMNLSFNFFRAITDGSNVDVSYASDTYSWFVRHTSRFNLPKDLDLQVRGNYEAPQITPQGRRLALYYLDFSMSKDIWKGKGTLTFNVLDVFNSRRIREITRGETFYSQGNFQGRRRQINLTLSYRLRQAKSKKPSNEEGGF